MEMEERISGGYYMLEDMCHVLLGVICRELEMSEQQVFAMLDQDGDAHISSSGAGAKRGLFAKGHAQSEPFRTVSESEAVSATAESLTPKPQGCGAECSPGSNVFRIYQYLRPPDAPLPGLRDPATGIHADMGLLTISPESNLPGWQSC